VTPSRGRVTGLLRGSGGVAVAIVTMNVATYGFQMVAARLLGPAQYGRVASLMALLLVVAVAQLGLQAVGARRVAADPGQVEHIERVVMRVAVWVALGLGLAILVLSPLIWRLLRLDTIVPALFIALAAVPSTLAGGQAGILQGQRRWPALGLLYLSMGVSRLVIATAFLAWRPTEGSAMAGVAVALFVPVVVGHAALRRGRTTNGSTHDASHHLSPVLRELVRSSQALLAFFVLSNVDIVVARNVLDGHQAGLYAGGLILTKAVLFLPQFVVIITFPSMSAVGERRRALLHSLVAVLVVGVVSVCGALVLSDLAMIFVGGDDYADVKSKLWAFAVLGTLLALLQMLVYSVLAREGARSAWLVWVAVAVLVTGSLMTSSLTGLVTVVIAVDAVLASALLVVSLHRVRDDAEAPVSDVTL
jgi:O-antigen/teichoic acid export membrane protein